MPRRIVRSTLMAVSLLICTAPAMAQSKAVIQKLNDAWMAAFNKGDGTAVAALYAEDAYLLPPGGDMIKGRDKIAAFWSDAAQKMGDAKLTTIDVIRLGRNAALEIGTVGLKIKGDPPQDFVGKYAVVWRRIDGQWVLASDIWNANK
jgi:uncharacterized protein (TIGR02246 family)